MAVKERLIQFVGYKNLSIYKFQQIIGVSSSYVQNIKDGIGGAIVQKIRDAYPELNIEWLINGNGDMLNEQISEQDKSNDNMIYVLPTSKQAGKLSEVINCLTDEDCEKIICPINDADIAIPVSGDSMTPEYPNGSKVIVKRVDSKAFIEWGRTYVLDTCNGIVIKNVYPSENSDFIKCLSINPSYPSFEIALSDIYGFWRVLMCMTMK